MKTDPALKRLIISPKSKAPPCQRVPEEYPGPLRGYSIAITVPSFYMVCITRKTFLLQQYPLTFTESCRATNVFPWNTSLN